MKMKKFLSSLTAGVMAATTILTSALVTPMMSLAATAADDAPIAFLHIQSSDGKWSLNNYKAGTGTDVTIDKSGSYEVSVKRRMASNTITVGISTSTASQLRPAKKL